MLLQNRSILVTGTAGLVGSNLIPRLIKYGLKIRAVLHQKLPSIYYPEVEYIKADLTQKDDCAKAVENVDFVIHCAAYKFGAGTTATSPITKLNANAIMNLQILEAAYLSGVKHFVWTGSITAYPPGGNIPLTEDQMFKADPFEKYFTVAWVLRFTEKLCQAYAEKYPFSMHTTVLRLSNVYGPHDNFDLESSNVIPALIRKTVERMNPLEVWGTGDEIRDVIYVDDIVDAILTALCQEAKHTVLNIGVGTGISVRQLLSEILKIDGYEKARVVFNLSKPSMIPIRLIDTKEAEKLWGFHANTALQDGLRQTINWYRSVQKIN